MLKLLESSLQIFGLEQAESQLYKLMARLNGLVTGSKDWKKLGISFTCISKLSGKEGTDSKGNIDEVIKMMN
jgi:hypothetical protein